MTQVVLIRPGATVYDEQNRVQGVLDVPLSDGGRAQVVELAEKLVEFELSALYCGPSQSAFRTAETIGKTLGLRPRRIDELRNLDQGLWQGLQIDEIRRRHLKVFREWLENPFAVQPPQGEDFTHALERIKSVLRPMIKRHRDDVIGLIACEPIAQLIAAHLRRDPKVQLDDHVPVAGYERITVPPEWGRNGDAS